MLKGQVESAGARLTAGRLVGLSLGMKGALFHHALIRDIRWGVLALILVILCIWLYSFSLFYTLCVGICLAKSIVITYAIYRWIFGLAFFPFMNLLSLVLLIGIGADDTFVLNFIFHRSKLQSAGEESERPEKRSKSLAGFAGSSQGAARRHKSAGAAAGPNATVLNHPSSPFRRAYTQPPRVGTDPLGRISGAAVRGALEHAVLSMLVTSVTTAAAFYANLLGSVSVVKCFGLFAATLVLVNFLLVITWLPASLVVLYRYINPGLRRASEWAGGTTVLGRLVLLLASDTCPAQPALSRLTDQALPFLINKLKWFWLSVSAFLLVASPVVIFYRPGLSLPDVNPLQLFRDSHKFEWFDNHAVKLFPFVKENRFHPMYAVVAWGLKPTENISPFDPRLNGSLEFDETFHMTSLADVEEMDRLCRTLKALPFVTPDHQAKPCWTSAVLDWLGSNHCLNRTAAERDYSRRFCCHRHSPFFNESRHLGPCLQYASKYYSWWWSSPAFLQEKGTTRIAAFTIEFKTNFLYSGIYREIRDVFSAIEGNVSGILASSGVSAYRRGFFVPSNEHAGQWLELLESLVYDTPYSVTASVAVALVVVILSTRTVVLSLLSVLTISAVILVTVAIIVLLGWRINVVESTVIILTVGLSFDFTLHYAVGYKLSSPGPRAQRVADTFRFIGVPVLLSALTTFLAGLAMVSSETNAFYQIGLFMMIVTAASYLLSTFLFGSLLAAFAPTGIGKWCGERSGREEKVAEMLEHRSRVQL